MDGGAWWAAVHGVTRSRTRLSNFTFTFHFHALEKKMATHSSVLAWRIPWKEEPGGLPSVGSHRVGHDWSDLASSCRFSNFIVLPLLLFAYSDLNKRALAFLNFCFPTFVCIFSLFCLFLSKSCLHFKCLLSIENCAMMRQVWASLDSRLLHL